MPRSTCYSTGMQLVGLAASALATVTSIASLSRLAYIWHDAAAPKSLSELAAVQDRLLNHFQKVLWTCGTLFAVAVYGAIAPNFIHGVWLSIAWTVTYLGDVLLAAVPMRGKTVLLHTLYAQAMALGMWGMAWVFFWGFTGWFKVVALGIVIAMMLLALLTFADKRRYIFYELAFLYLSHVSIILGAVFIAG